MADDGARRVKWRGRMSGVSGGEKNSGKKSATGKKPCGGEMGPGKIAENVSAADFDVLLVGHFRHTATEIPPGKPGARWAGVMLAALPSPRLIPAALGLVAAVSPLLQARGSRQWMLRLAGVRHVGSTIVAEVRARTPVSQLDVIVLPPAGRPLRAAELRAEREQLAAQVAAEKTETERLRAEIDAARQQRGKLTAQIAVYERQQAAVRWLEERIAGLKHDVGVLVGVQGELDAERERARAEKIEIRRLFGVREEDPRGPVELVAVEVDTRRKILAENVALRAEQAKLRADVEAMRQQYKAREEMPADALTVAALKLATQRAEKNERALIVAREDLAAARKSLSEANETLEGQKIRLHGAQRQLEAQEIELAEAQAELEFRRKWSIFAPVDEIRRLRRAAADKAREEQRKRPSRNVDG